MHRGATYTILISFALLSACTWALPADEGETTSPLAFACPTPSNAKITSNYSLTGQDLLRSSEYFDLMIAHGTVENLEGVLESARAEHNVGVASQADINRLEEVITARRTISCPDVPPYSAYEFGDVAFDGIAVSLEG